MRRANRIAEFGVTCVVFNLRHEEAGRDKSIFPNRFDQLSTPFPKCDVGGEGGRSCTVYRWAGMRWRRGAYFGRYNYV